ncbi:MAG: hypothetical protein EP329_08405 [Deltaproteobacteria bacterium]|nr:MAG: hypothetical protein EP329_08405 [Deltaproteobacteria bacterium]
MSRLLLALVTAATVAAPTAGARAASWCADPLWAHEWGVHVYGADGAAIPSPVALPDWFHTPARSAAGLAPAAVRDLPADNGVRFLPVLHLYSAVAPSAPIPLGVEVGFAAGPASAWYPAVDTLRPFSEATGPAAKARREALVAARQARTSYGQNAPLPADPTRQLVWDRLELTAAPLGTPSPDDAPWIAAARKLDALWVNRGAESERFVFYEAGTAEPLPLALRRADGWAPGHRAYVLENRGPHPVHDLVLTHEERGESYVFGADRVPAGGAVTFVLEQHRAKDRRAATWGRLEHALVDPVMPAPLRGAYPTAGPCAMMRDPAIPFEAAQGHGLFRGEVDLLLSVWGERFFDQRGTTLVWREDDAALSAAIPLSIYTDMYHYVVLQRAGLALWEHVTLP